MIRHSFRFVRQVHGFLSRLRQRTVLGNLGFGELMVIMVIVLVLFGAKRIPEISASFGKGIREFKRNVGDVEGSLLDSHTQPPIGARPAERDEMPRPTYYEDALPSEPKRLL